MHLPLDKSHFITGGSGVHVFLLCSGFGLYYSYLKKNVNSTQFIKRRFLKIYIPYIIVVLVSAMIPFMYDRSDRIIALLSHTDQEISALETELQRVIDIRKCDGKYKPVITNIERIKGHLSH